PTGTATNRGCLVIRVAAIAGCARRNHGGEVWRLEQERGGGPRRLGSLGRRLVWAYLRRSILSLLLFGLRILALLVLGLLVLGLSVLYVLALNLLGLGLPGRLGNDRLGLCRL